MVIGITGGIASGKSFLTYYLQELGYPVIDCDVITHQAYQEDIIQENIVKFFHTLDRKEIGNLVFSNPSLKKQLESILHPYIRKKVIEEIEKHATEELVFLDAPILIEAGFQDLVDRIIVVDAKDSIRLERLIKRDHISKSFALNKMHQQMSTEEKKQYADYILDNNGSLEETKININKLLETLRKEK